MAKRGGGGGNRGKTTPLLPMTKRRNSSSSKIEYKDEYETLQDEYEMLYEAERRAATECGGPLDVFAASSSQSGGVLCAAAAFGGFRQTFAAADGSGAVFAESRVPFAEYFVALPPPPKK